MSEVFIPPIVAQEVGLLHLQLMAANQRIAELEAQLAANENTPAEAGT